MDREELTSGIIFDIQGFSVHDGPGCRTLIFLKGCTLRCHWCSNPEGIHPWPEPMFNPDLCLGDGNCVAACPYDAIESDKTGIHLHRESCDSCFTKSYPDRENGIHQAVNDQRTPATYSLPCASACLSGAIKTAGYPVSVGEIYQVISRDRNYWGSCGGITLTGGEPLLQADFATALLKKCYEAYIHTAIETCGHLPWSHYENALPWLDLILFDIKHMDPGKHLAMTGVTNHLILENARKLAGIFKGKIIFRIPLIPSYNDDDENLAAVRALMEETGVGQVEVLPLHHLGREKYRLLGRKYPMDPALIPPPADVKTIRAKLSG
ncbi:MAG TPA: glycyl-radical enzyme activating protein [Bacteroidales bacterium]|nr:glycyl-radical enzyme activating protein [Bacteroidales bacterium]HSA43282.1 glycyl-radical enzyme activating protein [Bacteroidales bacterium]